MDLVNKLRMYGPFTFIRHLIYEAYLRIWMRRVKNSYSQRGEDIAIDRFLSYKKKGFYIDVGTNDPVRFSNTNRFYKRGWHGVNIEPNLFCYKKIKSARPRDINLNIGIGASNKELTFYKFFPDTLSTFSEHTAREYVQKGFKVIKKVKIKVIDLSNITSAYCKNIPIDFLTIDTEGYDLIVLKSNDWKRFRPKLICVEVGQKNIGVTNYLLKVGYNEVYNNGLNKIFIDQNIKDSMNFRQK